MGAVDLSEVEKTIWAASGWQADQRYVDTVLSTVERYAKEPAEPGRITTASPAAEAPAMREISASLTPLRTYQDASGQLWICMGQGPTEAPKVGRKKVCTDCGTRKPIENFRTYARDRTVHRPLCRECENRRKRERHAAISKGAKAS